MTKKERNQLKYLREKELACPLDKEEMWELWDLERKEEQDM